MPEIGVGHDRLRAVSCDDVRPALLDLSKRFVPRNALELPAALGSGATPRVEQAAGIVMMLGDVLELHAKAAAGHRVIRIACHLDVLTVLDVVVLGACIKTVFRAIA